MLKRWKYLILLAAAAGAVFWLQFGPSLAERRTAGMMPDIVFVPPQELRTDVCPKNAECLSARALYVPAEHRIYLRNDWSPDSFDDLGVLLHEFVHHLQTIGKLEYGCDPEIELPAYLIQEAFYQAHRRVAEGQVPSQFTRFVRYSCVAEE